MDIIKEKIKELYDDKALFSEKIGVNPKDLASKLRTVQNRFDFLNEFLDHLDLELTIKAKKKK